MQQIRLLHCRTMPDHKFLLPVLAAFLFATNAFAQQPQHLFFRVTLGPQFTAPVSGRLLIFLKQGSGDKEVDVNPFLPSSVSIAAKELYYWTPGTPIDIDTDALAFPSDFSNLKAGDYEAQAVLDVNHNYNYSGRSEGDLLSEVLPLKSWNPGQGSEPAFTLTNVVPMRTPRPSLSDQSGAHALLRPIDTHPRLGYLAPRLRRASRPALSNRLLDPRFRGHLELRPAGWPEPLQPHG
jgi:hypothetical protein